MQLNRAQQEMARQDTQRESAKHAGHGLVIMTVATVSIIGYLLLQVLLPTMFSGMWRIAALVPLLAMAPLIVHAIFAISAGSNLWPIFLIFAGPVAFGYLVLLAIARWIPSSVARA